MVAAFLIGAILGGGLGWALCLIARDYFTAQAMESLRVKAGVQFSVR